MLNDVAVGGVVVADTVAGPHHVVVRHSPCYAHSRSEVVAVRIHEARWKLSAERSRSGGQHGRRGCESGRHIQIHNATVHLGERRYVFVAQSEVER